MGVSSQDANVIHGINGVLGKIALSCEKINQDYNWSSTGKKHSEFEFYGVVELILKNQTALQFHHIFHYKLCVLSRYSKHLNL